MHNKSIDIDKMDGQVDKRANGDGTVDEQKTNADSDEHVIHHN